MPNSSRKVHLQITRETLRPPLKVLRACIVERAALTTARRRGGYKNETNDKAAQEPEERKCSQRSMSALVRVSYADDTALCKEFLEKYTARTQGAQGRSERKYAKVLQDISNRSERKIVIALDDLEEYFGKENADFVDRVKGNTRRYVTLFSDAVELALPPPTETHAVDDVFDVLTRQRTDTAEDNQDDGNIRSANSPNQLPKELTRRYEVLIVPNSMEKPMPLREVGAANVGKLVSIKGIVTRVTDVKPLISVATYTCDSCGFEIYQQVTGNTYMPVTQCPTQECKTNNTRGSLFSQTRGSKFVKFQEMKIQEMSDSVPMGHIPRSLTVHLRGELTRSCGPGDVVVVSGIFLPVPYTGFKAMRAGLTADTFLEATSVEQVKKSYSEQVITADTRKRVEEFVMQNDAYKRLARSIAPEIYGHEDIKKALLLLLVGGVTRQLPDGMKLRGDIHICLMGDPGVAKSQLLKHVTTVAPRAVYTTGRGSSGVGLTAAVTKDQMTGEMILEGGALVLADMGICCIDEFDKMEEGDRTAIHEVMEQQTVSIAKAGITTTLNARTTVLAAANPHWGRYDTRRSPAENIALPAALLSRFDLMWLILDKSDMEGDTALAQHVLHVHRTSRAPELDFDPLDAPTLRAYIAMSRQFNPSVPKELADYISAAYAEIRNEEASSDAPHSYTTARTLLSILRLGQALARLRFSEEVAQSDIDEALRLMKMSKISLYNDDRSTTARVDPITAIYSAIRDYAIRTNTLEVDYAKCVELITPKGYSQEQLKACLDEYKGLNVFTVTEDYDVLFGEDDLAAY